MFTPNEIRQITFEKVMRGYRPEDVEAFLEQIATEFEKLEKDKQELEEKLFVVAEKIEQYKTEEESIKSALINAHRLGENIIDEAKQKAEIILREANIKKNDILSAAHEELYSNEDALKRLKREVSEFKVNVLSLYRQHIESLSTLPEEKVVEEKISNQEPTQEVDMGNLIEDETKEMEVPSLKNEYDLNQSTLNSSDFEKDFPISEEKFKSISTLFDE